MTDRKIPGPRRSRLLAGTLVGCLAALPAIPAPQSVAGLLACREVPDPAARLACFDREASILASGVSTRDSVASPPTARAQNPTRFPPMLDPQQQFGLSEHAVAAQEVAAGARSVPVSTINAHLSRFAIGADGRVIFTLDNDQVWKQLIPEGELLLKQGDTVTISRGWLGSYRLELSSGRGCKVTRVQ